MMTPIDHGGVDSSPDTTSPPPFSNPSPPIHSSAESQVLLKKDVKDVKDVKNSPSGRHNKKKQSTMEKLSGAMEHTTLNLPSATMRSYPDLKLYESKVATRAKPSQPETMSAAAEHIEACHALLRPLLPYLKDHPDPDAVMNFCARAYKEELDKNASNESQPCTE